MLLDTLKKDKLIARKEGTELKYNLLTTLVAEATMVGKNKGNRLPTDEEVIQVIKKFISNANESLRLQFGDGAHIMVANQQTDEINILTEYLPQQLTEEQIKSELESLLKFDSQAKIGDLMNYLKANFNGKYDGKVASKVAKELLTA